MPQIANDPHVYSSCPSPPPRPKEATPDAKQEAQPDAKQAANENPPSKPAAPK